MSSEGDRFLGTDSGATQAGAGGSGIPDGSDAWGDFVVFRRMITPALIIILFWIGVLVSFLGGLLLVGRGMSMKFGGGVTVFSGLLLMAVVPLVLRIVCESLILFFRVNETLTDVRTELRRMNRALHNAGGAGEARPTVTTCPKCRKEYEGDLRGQYCEGCGAQL